MTALVGTGLATLVASLTGVAGLSGELQAAAKQTTPTQVLTPGEELHDVQRTHPLVLSDACAKTKHGKGKTSPDADVVSTIPAVPTTPGTTPQSPTSAKEY